MLTLATLAAVTALVSPTLALAQTSTPTPTQTLAQPQAPAAANPYQPAPPPGASFPLLAPATEATDCGGLLRTPAYCVTAQLTDIGTLAEQYIETLGTVGWLAADGDDNRVIFVRRREAGGCDGMQMIAFYDEARPVTPTTMGYLGFAAIPGDICVAPESSAAQGPASQ